MTPAEGDRAVSEVLGFILVFSFLVIAFTIYQGIAVPSQNKEAEFDHNREVLSKIQDLRDAIIDTAATGAGRSVTIQLGADYPQRTLAQNLGISAGALRTEDGPTGITIGNVSAADAETRDYLDDTIGPFESKSFHYLPVYSFYNEAPETIYENSVVFNRFDAANVTETDQLLVDDRKITLIALAGNLSVAKRDSESVSTEPISTSTKRIAVESNATGRPINVTIPSSLPKAKWEELLEEELTTNGGHVKRIVGHADDRISIVLEAGPTYELRMAKVSVGSGAGEEGAQYITDVEGDRTSVPENGTRKLVAEVRDRFNNPVSNVTVDANITTTGSFNGSIDVVENTTDSDGRVVFVYNATADVNGAKDVDVNVSFGGGANRSAIFDLKVLDSDGSGGTGPAGSGGNDSQFISMVRVPSGTVADGSTHVINVKVRNGSNKPGKGITVNASAFNTTGATQNGTFRSSVGDATFKSNFTQKTTDDVGEVQFNYTAPSRIGSTVKLRFAIDTANSTDNVTITVNVTDDGSLGGGGDEDGEVEGGGSGSGGITDWSSSNTDTSVSQAGGIFRGIGNAQNIYIKNPKFQSIKPNDGGIDTSKEYFRMVFVIEKNVTGQPTGTKRYMVVFPKDKTGITSKIDDAGVNWETRKISIYVDEKTNDDGKGWEKVVDDVKLNKNELDDWYTGTGPNGGRINLLDASNYQGGVQQSDLDPIKNFIQNNEVNIYFVDMYGRVDLNVE